LVPNDSLEITAEEVEDAGTRAVITAASAGDLVMIRDAESVLGEAANAARALQRVFETKQKRVVFNGQQYLEFEDWQTIARFYGCTARNVWSRYVQLGREIGFEARAEVVRSDGVVIGAGEGLCLKSERNWVAKPLPQLRSMAQTRAGSRALQSVFRWVAVLAGYQGTPAEELGDEDMGSRAKQRAVAEEKIKSLSIDRMVLEFEDLKRRLILHEPSEGDGEKAYYDILSVFGVEHSNDKRFMRQPDLARECYKAMSSQARQWEARSSPEEGLFPAGPATERIHRDDG
jgi:hypothetical protein